MNTKIKRFMSGILILVIIFSYVSVMARTNATPNYSSAVSSYSELESRLNSLISKYNNTYWTSNGGASNSSGDSSLYYYGIQCNGFAKLIFNDLFHCGSIGTTGGIYYVSNPNGAAEIARDTSVTADDAKKLLSSGSKGDFIQVKRRTSGGPHSMILAGKDENGVWIFDCNSDRKCGVKYQYQSWATFANKNIAMSLYHATNYPQGGGNTYLDIGTNFYANIIQRDNWATVINNNGSVEIGTENGYANELWWFERQDDGTYYIQSMEDNRYLDVDNAKTDNGTIIKVWEYSGSNAQKWYVKNGDHGFVIYPKNALNSCLDCTNASTSVGTKIQLWEQNGTAAQGFSIYKQGYFRFCDLGDTFYAPILNTDSWKPLLNSGRNLVLGANDTNNSDVLWQFKHNPDGTYTISSCLDGSCIDVLNEGSTAGTSVGLCTPNGCNAQRWYIGMYENGWVLKPKCAPDCVLDLIDNNTSPGTKFQLHPQNNTGAQKFSIYRGDECKLIGPALNVSVGNSASKTKFTWGDVYGESKYDVKIWKNKLYEGDAYHIEWGTNSGYEINLPAGTYQAYVDASNYFECKMSNVITFTVSDAVYNVNFNANGGSTPTSSKRVTYNSTYGDLPTPSRSGYRFLGWYTSASGGSRIESGTTFAITWDQTLYAHWSANSYNVVFNANGGSTPTSNKNVTYNSTYGDLPTPSRSGYRFLGWYTSANGGSRIESGTTVYITSNQTLYAQWERTAYTISYNTNGGSGVFESQTADLGNGITIPESVPEKDGYKFLGWAKAADAAYAEYRSGEQIAASGDMTLYAVWKIIPYTQTEIVNYGSYKIGTIQLNYVTAPAKIIIAKYKGNVFVGAEERDYKNSTETFAVIGDVDTVKIMVWEDMDGMTPVTSSEVKNF